jgi:putative peptide zinc metalloprotease protein
MASRDAQEHVSPDDVEASYRRLVQRIAATEAQSSESKGGFWFRRSIVPASYVARIAQPCSPAFHPGVAALFVAAIVLAAAMTFRAGVHPEISHFWPGYGLFLASLIAHELGHASACARYGAKPSEIGLTIYLIYPAFYSDVSAAWVLKRWQRVVVDLGGVYFQLVVGAVYALALALSGWEPLRVALMFIVGSCLFSLNPILKFDGYWVVADVLGVTNLSRQPARIVRHVLDRVRGLSTPPLPWSRFVTTVLMLYSVLGIGFWAWFLWTIARTLVPQVRRSVGMIAVMAERLALGQAWPDDGVIGEVLASVYVLVFVLLVLARLSLALFRLIKGLLSRAPSASSSASSGKSVGLRRLW